MKKYSFFSAVALFALFTSATIPEASAQSSGNLYKVFISAEGVTTNDSGRLAGVFASNREIIRRCANDNGITNISNLTLVYDRDADSLEVINRSTAELICTPIEFSGGLSLTNANGTTVEQLSFVYLDGSNEAAGTLRGTKRFRYDNSGKIIRFSFNARLQFALTGEGTRSRIYSAFLSVGSRFTPSGY
jgi:hypothetical protein